MPRSPKWSLSFRFSGFKLKNINTNKYICGLMNYSTCYSPIYLFMISLTILLIAQLALNDKMINVINGLERCGR
jgi:hypothetical protein